MHENLALPPKVILVDDVVAREPVLSERVLDENHVVSSDGLPLHLEAQEGVGMLSLPDRVEDICVDEANFLLAGNLCASRRRGGQAVQKEGFVV